VPDMLTEDETRQAFARMRANELTRLAGPGSAAAHRTVRRRRATTITVAAVTIGLALAGGSVVLVGADPPQPAPPAPGVPDTVSTGPDLIRLGEEASRALDTAVPGDYFFDGSGLLTSTVLDADPGTLPAGRIRLTATCVGAGNARFEIIQNRDAEGFDVICDGTPGSIEVAYQPVFTLYVSVKPDSAAVGHAGFAYRVH
jgi:hypothetical protein